MSSMSVLVVDDELDIRELICEILSEEGYDVTVASSASEANLIFCWYRQSHIEITLGYCFCTLN